MPEKPIIFALPPHLSDEAAYHISEFFYEIAMAVENHYAQQLKSYYKKLELEYSEAFTDKEKQKYTLLTDTDMPF